MKFLLDFLPLLLFFGTYMIAGKHAEWAAAFTSNHFGFLVSGGVVGVKEAPAMLATLVVIGASVLQVITLKVMRRKIDLMLWITLALVVVLGGATVWFHNPTFIKWKPSGYFWAMALALWLSRAVFKKNLLRTMLGGELQLPPDVWQRLYLAWIVFFSLMGFLNLYVAFSFEEATWVTFKVFGITGCMFVFAFSQVFYLSKHIKEDPSETAIETKT